MARVYEWKVNVCERSCLFSNLFVCGVVALYSSLSVINLQVKKTWRYECTCFSCILMGNYCALTLCTHYIYCSWPRVPVISREQPQYNSPIIRRLVVLLEVVSLWSAASFHVCNPTWREEQVVVLLLFHCCCYDDDVIITMITIFSV